MSQLLQNPFVKSLYLLVEKLTRFIPDKTYLKIVYWIRIGKRLNLDDPQTFNEKLQWLKLYDRKPIYTTMVDKHEVKKYVAERIGEQYIIPTLGVWNHFDEIDFSSLPRQFVLKCTHDSGGLVIVKDKDKLDKNAARGKIEKALKRNFYWKGREWPYKDVRPRIIAEQYLEGEPNNKDNAASPSDLRDYKLFSFDGEVKALYIATERGWSGETKFDFFDADFNHLPFANGHPNAALPPSAPKSFATMKTIAEKLSKGIPQVRVDFYEVNSKVYFGEITFSHMSGLAPFVPDEWDKIFGDWIHLPEKNQTK